MRLTRRGGSLRGSLGPPKTCGPLMIWRRPEMPEQHHPTPEERDERVNLPLDPEAAIGALLQVDPESEPVDETSAQRGRD